METFNFSREIPSDPVYDVLVAGGGPAGSAAAICAAGLGMKALRWGQSAATLDAERLVATLRENNAYLPQTTPTKEMTRNENRHS